MSADERAMTVSDSGAAPDVATFLRRHPWEEPWRSAGRTLDHYWVYDVAMPKHVLWPLLADTSAMNKRMGLPEMRFREEKGVVHGEQQRAGSVMRWVEVPWQWEYERGLENARIYETGAFKYLRARFEVHETGSETCRVVIYFGCVPRHWLGALVFRFGLGSVRASFGRVFDEQAAAWGRRERTTLSTVPAPLDPEALRRLREGMSDVRATGASTEACDAIERLLRAGPEEEFERIRVRSLARAWGLPERDVVVAFLQATRHGLFTLSWDVVCPHCRGTRSELSHLGEMPKSAECDVCEVKFDATRMETIEVTFHVHAAIRQIARRVYCAAEPARRSHIFVQRTLAAGAKLELVAPLPEGRYRLRIIGENEFAAVDVRSAAGDDALQWSAGATPTCAVVKSTATIALTNDDARPRTFVIETRSEDQDALRPSDLFGIQEFRDFFSQEAVAADVQLDIGMQTILFTDVVGSTRYYEVVGDSVAFAHVRQHFVQAYEHVRRHGGVIVKTIGDAVMAAFPDPASAVAASVDIQRHFDGRRSEANLRLRISIHTGPCLAVNLNTNIDYFGSTVNLAAKLQAVVESGQIGFSDVVRNDSGVKALIERERLDVEPVDFTAKWSGEKVAAFRVTVS